MTLGKPPSPLARKPCGLHGSNRIVMDHFSKCGTDTFAFVKVAVIFMDSECQNGSLARDCFYDLFVVHNSC